LVLRLWGADIEGVEKEACLEMLLTLIVRRSVCSLTTKNYNKFFLTVIAHLDENEWSSARLAAFLLAQKSETGRFPRDEEFENKWLSSPTYTVLQPARARAVLEEIEIAKRTKFNETKSLADHLTVEHILPKEWRKDWPLPDGTTPTSEHIIQALFVTEEDETPIGRIVRRDRLKETIGNLTLLTQPLNSTVRNGPYQIKREALKDHSLLVLNREITKSESWDEDAIVSRSRGLFDTAKSIWPLPKADLVEGPQ
jgi:hypothetical protein